MGNKLTQTFCIGNAAGNRIGGKYPRGGIRPKDRFDAELASEHGWEFDDGIALLPSVLASEFGGAPEDYDLSKNPTVIGLLTLVRSKSSEHR